MSRSAKFLSIQPQFRVTDLVTIQLGRELDPARTTRPAAGDEEIFYILISAKIATV